MSHGFSNQSCMCDAACCSVLQRVFFKELSRGVGLVVGHATLVELFIIPRLCALTNCNTLQHTVAHNK